MPLGRPYSPVDGAFARRHSFGFEAGQFLEPIGDVIYPPEYVRALASAPVGCFFETGSDEFDPEVWSSLRVDLDRRLFDTVNNESELSGPEYIRCMGDAGFPAVGDSIEEYGFARHAFAGIFPVSEFPEGGSEPGPRWLADQEAELAMAMADADCRRVALRKLDAQILDAVSEFLIDRMGDLAALPFAWEAAEDRIEASLAGR